MSEGNTVRMSLEEVVRRLESGITSSDWERVDALTDEEIEAAIDEDPDAERLTEDWFRRARLVIPGEELLKEEDPAK